MPILRSEIRDFWLYRWAQTRSLGWTRTLARRRGESFGFVYVGGYAKSGTTWASRLVADYLGLPLPLDYALPPAFRCLIHHHWRFEPWLGRSMYVLRDGRDVMVSEFVSMMRGVELFRERAARFGTLSPIERLLLARVGRDANLWQRLERVFGRGFDPWDVPRNLPIFIDEDLERPWSSVVPEPWHRHVAQWMDQGREVVFVRYEDLLADGVRALTTALGGLTGAPVDSGRVEAALARFEFGQATGRERGVEDRASFLRKGIAGDWKNYFDRSAAEAFDRRAGQALIRAGYEPDRQWVTAT